MKTRVNHIIIIIIIIIELSSKGAKGPPETDQLNQSRCCKFVARVPPSDTSFAAEGPVQRCWPTKYDAKKLVTVQQSNYGSIGH
jgi:hypothetical protein